MKAWSVIVSSSIGLVFLLAGCSGPGSSAKGGPEPIHLVVMDPLAKELACACVKDYGQRDYRKLAAKLGSAVGQRVSIEFSDDLAESLAELGLSPMRPADMAVEAGSLPPARRQIIVIGDRAQVANGAKQAGLKCHPVCELTDSDGNTTLDGLFVARADDSVRELKDLGARKVFFGVAEADEKFAASLAALRAAGLTPAAAPEMRSSFTGAALDVLDSQLTPPPVVVIPGYALRLLEGCGSVTPGKLRVIGRTQAVPFITVYMADAFPAGKEAKLVAALMSINADAKMLQSMESRDGFKLLAGGSAAGASAGASWPDWRGPARDGHVARLPAKLPAKASFVWKKGAMTGGLAGLSVGDGKLILAERDFAEEHDVYRCLNASSGELLWRVEFPASGKLDYGQSPRATPVIHAGRAYLLGAFGGLRCVNLADGKVIWERSLPADFKARLPTWGMCSTPLLVDDLLIVNPGGPDASLAALDCATGQTRWTTPGTPAAYSSLICGEFGARREIVGYDQHSLGGWDVKTGQRLWQLVPPTEGDFNVPTPVAVDGGLLAATENNGTRLYRFDDAGVIIPKPAAEYAELSPTTATPVVTCGRVFGSNPGLNCLDIRQGLKSVWHQDEAGIGDHATLIADDERVLVITLDGELILLDGRADACTIISRLRIFNDDVEVYAHPALAGTRLYARGGSSVVCVDLGKD